MNRSIFARLLLVSILSLLSIPAAFAQTPSDPPKNRPKIGIVLGGGAALGIAHVGVLLWMEKNRIPIDYISGTSMGGLVGGAYATGLSADELKSLIENINWRENLAADFPYTWLQFRRKEDKRAYPTILEFGGSGGLKLPSGLTPVPVVSLLLSRIAAEAGPQTGSYDDLAIPFRCVAVDLNTGKAVTLGDGSLALSLRATMAIPGLFAPVRLGDALLVDGGILNNVPVDVAKKMGADVVIAVDVYGIGATTKYDSYLDVLVRTAAVVSSVAAVNKTIDGDVLLRPNLKGFTSESWTSYAALIDQGYKIAEANAAKLRAYALPEDEWKLYLAKRRARRFVQPIVPQFIAVKGSTARQRQSIQQALQPLLDKPLVTKEIESRLKDVAGSGRYTSLIYSILKRDNQIGLEILANEKNYPPPFINIAPIISSAQSNTLNTVLTGRATWLEGKTPGRETRLDIGLGTANSIAAEQFIPIFHPTNNRIPFLSLNGNISDDTQPVYVNSHYIADYNIRRSEIGLDVGIIFGRTDELRLGGAFGTLSDTIRVGSPTLPTEKGATRLLRFRWTHDGQDAPVLPRRGLRIIAEAQHILASPGASGESNRAEVNANWFRPASLRDTLFAGAALGTNWSGNVSPGSEFLLGGNLRLSAYPPGEIRGRRYERATVGYLHELSPGSFIIGGRTNVGAWLEAGNAQNSAITSQRRGLPTNVSVGSLIESPLGPILFGGSVSFDGRGRLFFSVGRFL